ncbi:MAG: tetratricopeptide repeat protein [Reinekea sp.]
MFVTRDDLKDELLIAEEFYELENMPSAISLFEELSRDGMPEATRRLAFIYLTGDGVEKDEVKARKLYNQSVDQLNTLSNQGNSVASLALGKIYQYGNKCSRNFEFAIRFFKAAIDQGSSEAMLKMAHIYRFGWCDQDQSEDCYLYYLEMAVKHSEPEALYEKGLLLKNEDENLSLKLIKQSANSGFYPASEYLENLPRQ